VHRDIKPANHGDGRVTDKDPGLRTGKAGHDWFVLGGRDADRAPCWSPDGKWIVTRRDDASGPGLFKIPAEGGAPIRLAATPGLNPAWSPDGTAFTNPSKSAAILPDIPNSGHRCKLLTCSRNPLGAPSLPTADDSTMGEKNSTFSGKLCHQSIRNRMR
jgi:Tol biopolymer transport system component